jgi:hypothetical protein
MRLASPAESLVHIAAPLASAMVSPWIVLPIAAIAILLLALQAVWTQRDSMPVVRRQIRTAGATLHLFTVVALAIGLGIIDPADRRMFVMIWLIIMMLVGLSVVIALLDVLQSLREARAEQAALKRELADRLRAHRSSLNTSSAPAAGPPEKSGA